MLDPSQFVDLGQDSEVKLNHMMRKSVKIMTDHSSVVSGLKCLLQETVGNLFCNLSEDYFNVDAKPFIPAKKAAVQIHSNSFEQ